MPKSDEPWKLAALAPVLAGAGVALRLIYQFIPKPWIVSRFNHQSAALAVSF